MRKRKLVSVYIQPMPVNYRKIPEWYRPGHPPIFDGDPTDADIELARDLFAALDAESQAWYGRCTVFDGLVPDPHPPAVRG